MKTIGRYEIKRQLGRGGMATVYLANDPRFERNVAIKVLPREFLHDPAFRARFEREAKTIASLEQPAIVPVYDFGEQDGQPYLVMRYMVGGTLRDRLDQGPMTLSSTASILDRLAPALDNAHRLGIVHRDLKPGNILFDSDGNPYIADFGIAKLLESNSTLTGTGVVGTPAYMSPEQVEGEVTLDGRSDIYALGIMLYEMLAGKQPYQADTPMSMALMHLRKPVPHVREVAADVPVGVDQVIATALNKNRDERFGTVGALASAFRLALDGEWQDNVIYAPPTVPWKPQPGMAQAPPPSNLSPQTKSNIGWRIWPVALLFVILGSAVIAYLTLGNRILGFPGIAPFSDPTATASPTDELVIAEVGVGPAVDAPVPTRTISVLPNYTPQQPTATPAPPSATPEPPTDTPIPPTDTPVPPATLPQESFPISTAANLTSQPTMKPTVVVQQQLLGVPTALYTDRTLYDDFNDPEFDGSFNRNLWRYWDDTQTIGFSQEDGVLNFFGQNPTGLIARKHIDLLLREPTFYEARLMLNRAAAGSVTIKLHGSLPNEHWWSTQCGITAPAGNSEAWAFCDYGSKDTSSAYTSGEDVKLDSWHTFRIEVTPSQSIATYYIDGEARGNTVIPEFDELRFSLVQTGLSNPA